MKRTAILLYGLLGYLLGVAALAYLVLFLFNLGVAKTLDSGRAGSPVPAMLADLGLIALFGLQHSVMARRPFKAWLTRFIPSAAERSTFMLATAAVTFALCLAWRPLPQPLWQVHHAMGHKLLLVGGLGGWGLVLYASFLINHFDLFGLRQVWLAFTGQDSTPVPFQSSGLYKVMRHPIQAGALLGVWVTPSMTVGHLVLALGMTIYILIGVYHEEQDLIRDFGIRYRQYMKATGKFWPALGASATAARQLDPQAPEHRPG
ncbi:MAG: hypothetical protein U0P81_08865 [Holophagaceae bacterium]